MRYSSTASAVLAACLATGAAVSAAPSYQSQQQLTFLDPVAEQAASFLKESKAYVDTISGSVGNVAQKGAKWINEHINDPRCEFYPRSAITGVRFSPLCPSSAIMHDDAASSRTRRSVIGKADILRHPQSLMSHMPSSLATDCVSTRSQSPPSAIRASSSTGRLSIYSGRHCSATE